jgi:hypothetical protein
VDTLLSQYIKALSANSTDTSFDQAPTTTKPSGDGVIEARRFGEFTNSTLLVVPYGVGSADDTFDLRVIGWRCIDTLWVPTILCQVACTLGTATGVDGAAVDNSESFADTISLTSPYGTSGVDVQVSSPADNTVGHFLVDAKGHELIEFCFDLGTADSANALVARL